MRQQTHKTMVTIKRLKEAGGNEWQKGTMHRFYFNDIASRLGYDVDYYNTGNISSARHDGEHISNSEMRRRLDRWGGLYGAKFWYDVEAQEFRFKGGFDDEEKKRLVESVTK